MDARDKARSDLYLAQLRSQSAPNTPGFAYTPRTPRFPTTSMTEVKEDPHSAAENGHSQAHFTNASPQSSTTSTPFKLQAPPTKFTPKTPQVGFAATPTSTTPPRSSSPEASERRNDHIAAAPGEQVYESVPIPGAYATVSAHQQGTGQAY